MIAKILPARPTTSDANADVVLEIAFLMTAVDGHLADEELPAFREVGSWMRGHTLSDEEVGILLGRFSENMERGEIEERVRAIAKTVPADLREVTFQIAIGLALVDKEAAPEEDALVGILFEGLGLTMARADALADEVRKAFA